MTATNLRPIILLECMRKLWVGITTKKIQDCWERHRVLHPSQHGYRLGTGTDSAIIQLINLLENAKESATPVFLSSWDIKKAFDSPSFNVLKLAWARLGVPWQVAEYLVSLDEGDSTVIKSPWAEDSFSKLKYKGFTSHKPTLNGKPKKLGKLPTKFTRQRGVAQGDVRSPPNWNAFYDILLCALDRLQDADWCHFIGPTGAIHKSPPLGFVDDLVSSSCSVAGLQQQADLISVFALVFGLQISATKLRTFKFSPAPSPPGAQLHPNHITIYGEHWEAAQVVLKEQGTFKFLGLWFDCDLEAKNQYHLQLLHDRQRTSCQTLKNSRGSAFAKLEALRTTLSPRVIYGAKLCDWTWNQLLTLDTEPASLVRSTCSHMPGFPTVPLLHPAKEGGQGVKRLSVRILEAKLAIFHRLVHRNDPSGLALRSMVARLARQAHVYSPGHTFLIPKWDDMPPSVKTSQFFLRNLLEAGSLASLQLTVDADNPPLSSNTSLGSLTTDPSIYTSHCHHIHNLTTVTSLAPRTPE